MRIATIIVRTLMGLLFLFASISVLFNLMTPPPLEGNAKAFMDGMMATGYLFTLIKVTELVCGVAFVSGYFVPLAAVVISPIIINIFFYHLYVDPTALPVAIALVLCNLFLGFAYRDKFRPLLQPK